MTGIGHYVIGSCVADELKFSVLLSVYINDSLDQLVSAVESVIGQTRPPDQLVIVLDGPVSEPVREFVESLKQEKEFFCTVLDLKKNVGLGVALKFGLDYCEHDLVARMDADDISVATRFEKQLDFLRDHPEISVLGGNIVEFDEHATLGGRAVAQEPRDVMRLARRRNPVNHVTVMFRKTAVLAAGGYRDFPTYEDYDLWIRMIRASFLIFNLSSELVFVRAGNDMANRRRGFQYLKNDFRFFLYLYKTRFISGLDFGLALLIRIPTRLGGRTLTKLIYSLLRKR